MFDLRLRRLLAPALSHGARVLADRGATANGLTAAGAAAGVGAGVAIGSGAFLIAALLVLLSRLCDGLDGPLARLRSSTPFGGYIDLLADYVFYCAVPLGFAAFDPSNTPATAVLLTSYVFTAVSFLAFSSLAQQYGLRLQPDNRSFVFQPGLAEGTETIATYLAMLLWPLHYSAFAFAFAAICFYTAVSRTVLVYRTFRH